MIDEQGMISWAELDRRANRLAHVLLGHGQAGDCVAFMLRNGREAVECYAAGGRSGLVPVPLNTWATSSELARILHMQRPAVLIADAAFDEVVAHAVRHLPDPPAVLSVGEQGAYETALSTASPVAPATRGTTEIVIHTSGTTGAPKGGERNMGPSQIGALLGFVSKVPLRRGDRLLIGPPLFHAFASGVMGAACVLGATLVLPRTFEPAVFGAHVRDHDIAAAALVPTCCAGPWRMTNLPAPGSTEAGGVAMSTPSDFKQRRGTVGRPGPGMRVEVVDHTGTPAPAGQIGALRVRTGMEFSGYTGSDRHRGAWDMGDLGYLDADGYLYVTGRRDEMMCREVRTSITALAPNSVVSKRAALSATPSPVWTGPRPRVTLVVCSAFHPCRLVT